MRKYLAGFLLVIYAGALSANQDSDFLAARKAFQAGNSKLLAEYADRLTDHVLSPYVDYYQLRSILRTTDVSNIRNFLSRHEGTLVADRLRSDWLKMLGKNQQWQLFDAEYPLLVNKDTELSCYVYQRQLSAKDKEVVQAIRDVWLTAGNMPESCTPVFNSLIASGQISVEDIWTRIRFALEEGQTTLAKQVGRYLPGNETLNVTELGAADKNPLRYLDAQKNQAKTRSDREIILFALLRLLRNDTNQAYAHWVKVKDKFNETDRSYFLARLGHRSALRHDSRALNWFMEAQKAKKPYPLTDTLLAWQARAALRVLNWAIVLKSIEGMSVAEQQVDTWRYWKGRALKEQGRIQDANAIFAPLSAEHTFYGQLAKEELGTVLSVIDETYHVSNDEVSAMEKRPAVRRTLAFNRIDLRTEAYHEWVWAIRNFNDSELLAAAEVARRHGMYDRAINTANRTVSQHNFNLRFLSPHREVLQEILQQHELDEAWVYGLIRQESRFITDIKSSAGAMGLMQLMPATAEWVAKKLGMQNFREHVVVDVNTNLKLGTYYLKHVLTTLDNQPLLASAAYNAGPGRARRWRDETIPLEGAIYAETIPFNETRTYVKKVLKNSVYYAKVLDHGNETPTLKERLGVVATK